MPGAAHMVSTMSCNSLRISSSIVFTGSDGVCSTGVPHFTMGLMAMLSSKTRG
jgi:hypothetical protein